MGCPWLLFLHAHSSYHVCAVGNLPEVGVDIIWNAGDKSLNPPGGSCEQP